MTKREIMMKSISERRLKLLILPWKQEIHIGDWYYCPVCEFKTKKLLGLSSHLAGRKFCQLVYDNYFGDQKFCRNCGEPTKFISLGKGYQDYCSEECTWKDKTLRITSKEMKDKRLKGLSVLWDDKEKLKTIYIKNKDKRIQGLKKYYKNIHQKVKEERSQKQSESMRSLIKSGKFKPNINNVYNGSMTEVGNIKFRSSWEAAFYLLNRNVEYEKFSIPYTYKGKERNYFVDFVDEKCKIIYEIKPISRQMDEVNVIKDLTARRWSKNNGYSYIIVDETYFIKNMNVQNTKSFPVDIKRKMGKIINETG
jgi:hypothetical protein